MAEFYGHKFRGSSWTSVLKSDIRLLEFFILKKQQINMNL